jgi:hypothetical protein
LLLSRPSHSRDARRVRRDPQERRGPPDRKAQKANKVPRGLKAEKVSRVALGRKDLKAQKANKAPPGRKGLKAQKANRALRVQRVPLVKQDRVQPVQRAYMRSSRIDVIRAPIATSNAARAKSWFR